MIIMNNLLLNPAETFGMKQKWTFFFPLLWCVYVGEMAYGMRENVGWDLILPNW